jgi:hypothetical protein
MLRRGALEILREELWSLTRHDPALSFQRKGREGAITSQQHSTGVKKRIMARTG